MDFKLEDSIKILSQTPEALEHLLKNIPQEWIRNNEGENSWSPFEVVAHLIGGEKTDWIERTKVILNENGDKRFQPFDRLSEFEESSGKSVVELIEEFKSLRNENLEFLKSLNLKEADLNKIGLHPDFGEVTLRQLLSTWTVHDLSHINQITRVLAKNYDSEVGPWKKYLGILSR